MGCTLQVHIAGDGKKYPLDVHSSNGGKGCTLHCTSTRLVKEMDTPCESILLEVEMYYTPCTFILQVV
jgi:hypothetical protein